MSESKPIRIPFDSFTLAAFVEELVPYVGAKVQEIRQPSDTEVVISLYARGSEAMLLLSCHPEFARAHFVTKRAQNQSQPPVFCSTLRSRLDGARLAAVRQIQGDRVLELCFTRSGSPDGGTMHPPATRCAEPESDHRLIAELMGKHSNLILIDESMRILAAAKWVGASKSSRPIQPNGSYVLPPVMGEAGEVRRSPFLQKLLEARARESTAPLTLTLPSSRGEGPFGAVLSPGHGAYPISVAALGLPEFERSSISVALEQHYAAEIPRRASDALRTHLVSRLERSLLAKEVALAELRQAEEAGLNAGQWQRFGEMILTYGSFAPAGSAEIQAWDNDGNEVKIKVEPDLDFKQNSARYFERAKKAKGRIQLVKDQIERVSDSAAGIRSLLEQVRTEEHLSKLQELEKRGLDAKWLTVQAVPAAHKEDRPYEGHRIRELLGPGGYTVLYGENSESNDYLTLRVAKPNDYWLHVRGDVSAHVIVRTRNHPEKIQMETLRFAASVAAKNSRAKHSGYISVDYTLKKYVRRPRGAAVGSVQYSNEKTIEVFQ